MSGRRVRNRRGLAVVAASSALLAGGVTATASASTPGGDVRLTQDAPGLTGYSSVYTQTTGVPYTDAALAECSRARGRQNEPSVAVDPRDTRVVVGSSNDYCATYDGGSTAGAPDPTGPIWLGYYRSTDGGAHFSSSLMPGYPGDTSPYAARSGLRTASAGDPVLAWDSQGRLFQGTETSGDPAGTSKSFGDVGVATYQNPDGPAAGTVRDGQEFLRSVVVDRGAAGATGKFADKTAIEVDRTGGRCDGTVYFAYSRFTGSPGRSNIYVARSTDHGATFSHPALLTTSVGNVQFPDIAVTHDGTVAVTYVAGHTKDTLSEIQYARSTTCGASFAPTRSLVTFQGYSAQDVAAPTNAPPQTSADDAPATEGAAAAGSTARDCGDFSAACRSGYTFFRRDTQARSTADQGAAGNRVHVAYDPLVPGSEQPTGTTYGAITPGRGGRSGIYYLSFDVATGVPTTPVAVAPEIKQQTFPDLSVDGGTVHMLWWDSINDTSCSDASDCARRPIGNTPSGGTRPSLDVYGKAFPVGSDPSSTVATRVSDVTTNPNAEQFGGRTVPFAGDYLWIDSQAGATYGTWTDWRDTVLGTDQREVPSGEDPAEAADVLQCRTTSPAGASGDTCPRAGGLDQNIYGDALP